MSRRVQPVALVVSLVVGLLVTVPLVWPQAFGAQTAPLIAQLISFRAGLALVLGGLALVSAVVAVLRRRWAVAAGIAMVLGAASAASGAILLARGSADTLPDAELTVVAWNTQGGAATPESIARLVLETGAEIVSLPETDEGAAAQAARLVGNQGRRMLPATTWGETGDSSIPTSVLIDESLGAYGVDGAAGSTPGLPSAVWRPLDGSGPIIVAAHPMPPLPSVSGVWKAGLEWVADQCRSPDVIVAGDLNATVDHLSSLAGTALIGDCRDAAAEAGSAAVGTWPSTVPAWLAAPIDHVLVGSAWTVRGAAVVTGFDEAGSDHRPIVAVLDPR